MFSSNILLSFKIVSSNYKYKYYVRWSNNGQTLISNRSNFAFTFSAPANYFCCSASLSHCRQIAYKIIAAYLKGFSK